MFISDAVLGNSIPHADKFWPSSQCTVSGSNTSSAVATLKQVSWRCHPRVAMSSEGGWLVSVSKVSQQSKAIEESLERTLLMPSTVQDGSPPCCVYVLQYPSSSRRVKERRASSHEECFSNLAYAVSWRTTGRKQRHRKIFRCGYKMCRELPDCE